jgi:hypothetical protein
MLKFLVTGPGKDAVTHVVDAPTEDSLITFARRKFGAISWFCETTPEAIENFQVGPLGVRERPIGSGRTGPWSEWAK